MKNSQAHVASDSGVTSNSGFTKTVIATSFAAALSGAALADEGAKKPLPTPKQITSQVRSDVHAISQTQNQKTSYDARTNTLTLAAKQDGQKEQELKMAAELRKAREESEKQDVEKLFGIDLSMFDALYTGNLNALDGSTEVAKLLSERDALLEKRSQASDEEAMKSIDKELVVVSRKITNAKEKASIEFFDALAKKLQGEFPAYEQKLAYVSGLDTENGSLKNFISFARITLTEGVAANTVKTPLYKDSAYISEEQSGKLVTKTSEVDKSKYTEEQKTGFRNRFVKLSDVHNTTVLSEYVNESNAFDYLSDLNNDGKVSDMDTGVFYGKQLSVLFREIESQMKSEGKEAAFYNNLSYIFAFGGVKTSLDSKADLVTFLKGNPLAKLQFNDAFYRLNISGADVGYVLRHGAEGVMKWEQAKGKILKDSPAGNLLSKIQDGTKNLKKEIARLKSEGVITDQEYSNMLTTLEKTINSPKWEEQVMSQALTLLSSISATYFSSNSGGIQANYSNSAMNMQLSQITKQFIDSVELSTGVYNTAEGNMLMLGLTYKGAKKLSETEALTFNTGVNFGVGSTNNVLPVLGLGYIKNTNAEELKEAGIVDFDQGEKSFKVGASLSMMNTKGIMLGVGFKFSSDKKAAIEKKVGEYSKLLDTVFACDTRASLEDCMQHIQAKITSAGYEKVNFLQDSLVDTEARLKIQGFDKLSSHGKQRILEEEKMFYVTKFLNSQASTEEEKGWTVSGWGLGLSLLTKLAGIPIIPGIEASKTSMRYAPHQSKKTMTEAMHQEGVGETVMLRKGDKKLGESLGNLLAIEGLAVSYQNGYLTLVSATGNIGEFLAQNGVDVRVGVAKKALAHVSLAGNTLTIGDVGKISCLNVLTAEGKRVTLVIGDRGSKGAVELTPTLEEVLKKHPKEELSGDIEFTYANIAEQQVGDLFTKKFGLGIF